MRPPIDKTYKYNEIAAKNCRQKITKYTAILSYGNFDIPQTINHKILQNIFFHAYYNLSPTLLHV